MLSQKKADVWQGCIARLCAATMIAALFHSAKATDLGSPELTPVTRGGVNGALGAEMNMASRRVASGIGNSAALVSTIVQQGSANQISLVQSGKSNYANVDQQGTFNSVSANQRDQSNSLDVAQQGNGNSANFNQTGGTRASVIQTGDLHKADIYQASTSPNIVIRQSGIGTVVQTTQY